MWGMGDHSRPLHTYDATCHVPLIFRHPASIPAGKKLDLMVSNYDLMPTVLSYLGFKDSLPDKPPSPGRDYSAALRGQRLNFDNIIFYEFENSRMVRTPEWKYTRRFPDGPDELYDLTSDAGERHNLANQPKHAGIQKRLAKKLDEFFNRYADPKYDLWRGGGSKTYLLTSPQKPLR
jgi:arylsulfatase A-like enzyme